MLLKLFLLYLVFRWTSASGNFEKNLMKTWQNSSFYGFRGIKYAEPPIGALRFKAPVPIKTWHNISHLFEQPLDKDGSDCPSPTSDLPYNEDCLYLNVYTKNVKPAELRPVIVFIHPGGLHTLSGSSKDFGPEYILEEDVVLVAFNYRLLHFGFTSVGTKDASGNAGFKDQVLVLKWVQDHIHHFGGNKELVTLMGYSAGGLSTSLHLVSPMSRNLFHRAFIMSSSMLPQAKLKTDQSFLVTKLARFLNCDDAIDSFECVKQSDTHNITMSLRPMFEFGFDHPIYRWLPVIEPKIDEEDRFLDRDPMEHLQEGNFNKVPILMSTAKNELALSTMYLFEHPNLLKEFLKDFSRVGPICLQYEPNQNVSDSLIDWYNITDSADDRAHYSELFDRIAACYSDGVINFPTQRLAQIARKFTDVYVMKFNFKGAISVMFRCDRALAGDFCDEINEKGIVDHADDLQYLFTSKPVAVITDESSKEGQVVKRFTKLLYGFAKDGYPSYGPDIDSTKTKYDDDETYVAFNEDFRIEKVPFKTVDIWNRLFPLK